VWKELSEAYEGSSSVVIGAADCTADGKALCDEVGVSGYPTIKYFPAGECATPKDGKDYQGGRSLDDLKKFVADNLEVKCDVASPEGCTEKEVKFIAKMRGKGKDAVVAQAARLGKMKGNSMKKELKQWVLQRHNIVTQLEKEL
jgi:protein disulfide-isomerase A6|tara:strand:+ start:56 stop:487 length:432 start_codon:yes stop_codon:yes gene_type:complete